jgi:hypothetical protein
LVTNWQAVLDDGFAAPEDRPFGHLRTLRHQGVVVSWEIVAGLATAVGTLVLATATFAAVRSSNRSARVAERSLLAQLRPLLLSSHQEESEVKVGFQDDHWVHVPGGKAHAEVTDQAIYLIISLRNVGTGLAILNGWAFHPDRLLGAVERPDPSTFRRLTRDLFIPAGDRGFWQGTYRDPADPAFHIAADVIRSRKPFSIDVLYGDLEGGQRIVTRFSITPVREDSWIPAVSHHWNLDRPDPR